MPLQNRVTPAGDIMADPARGLFMGNRGGRFHDVASRTLKGRHWASRQWIICVLEFKNRHRKLMGNSYTELFFLDEVTALSAGHRPCFECRRSAAVAFFAAHDAFRSAHSGLPPAARRLYAAEMDTLLHTERIGPDNSFQVNPLDCPDGTMFNHQGDAWAKRNGQLLRWSPPGYDRAIPLAGIPLLVPLTPATTIGILAHGYEPAWHASAEQF